MLFKTDASTSKNAMEEYLTEIKTLPIRMEDRRNLYKELLEIYEFKKEILHQDGVKKQNFCCFRLRKFCKYLKYYFSRISLWESSLREIEIQRGRLTVNVFLFIKWTFKFNLVLSAIVFLSMISPHYIVHLYIDLIEKRRPAITCTEKILNEMEKHENGTVTIWELSRCCSDQFQNSTKKSTHMETDPTLQNLRKMSEFIGVKSTWLNSFLLYGYYRPPEGLDVPYRPYISMLYALFSVIIIAFSISILFKDIGRGIMEMVQNKESETAIFSDLIFCGYYHSAEDENDSRFRRKLWLHELKVALKRAKALTKIKAKADVRLVIKRVVVFLGTTLLITLSGVAIFILADESYRQSEDELHNTKTKWTVMKYVVVIIWALLPSLAISLCNFILPNIFIKISRFEKYSVEVTTVIVLLRSLIVRLLSLGLTIYKIFSKNHCDLKPNSCVQCKGGGKVNDCWESLIGVALYKVIFVELCVKILMTLIVDPIRNGMRKVFSGSDVMQKFGTLRFNVIRHSLDIMNVQVLCWMGFYFAPAYPFVVSFYLVITFYLKKFSVLHNCIGNPESHRVARTTTIFQMGELFALLIVTAFLIMMIGDIRSSVGCGPFAEYSHPWKVMSGAMKKMRVLEIILEHISSPSVYMPLEVLGLTILYYLYCAVGVNSERTDATKDIMKMETEDKLFLISKLQMLRSKFKDTHFYDPLAIFESEKAFLVSSQKAKALVIQAGGHEKRSKLKTTSDDGTGKSLSWSGSNKSLEKGRRKFRGKNSDKLSSSSDSQSLSKKSKRKKKEEREPKTKKDKSPKKKSDTDTEAKDTSTG